MVTNWFPGLKHVLGAQAEVVGGQVNCVVALVALKRSQSSLGRVAT